MGSFGNISKGTLQISRNTLKTGAYVSYKIMGNAVSVAKGWAMGAASLTALGGSGIPSFVNAANQLTASLQAIPLATSAYTIFSATIPWVLVGGAAILFIDSFNNSGNAKGYGLSEKQLDSLRGTQTFIQNEMTEFLCPTNGKVPDAAACMNFLTRLGLSLDGIPQVANPKFEKALRTKLGEKLNEFAVEALEVSKEAAGKAGINTKVGGLRKKTRLRRRINRRTTRR